MRNFISMIGKQNTIVVLGLLAILAGATSPALALPTLNGGRPALEAPRLNASPARRTASMDDVIATAERRYNGRAVGARHMGNGIYRVRILQNNGKVKNVTIDGNTLGR